MLNAETLKDLTQFLFTERDTISKRELELRPKSERTTAAARSACSASVTRSPPARRARSARPSYSSTRRRPATRNCGSAISSTTPLDAFVQSAGDRRPRRNHRRIQRLDPADERRRLERRRDDALDRDALARGDRARNSSRWRSSSASSSTRSSNRLSAAANYKQVQRNLAQLGKMRGSQIGCSTRHAERTRPPDQGKRFFRRRRIGRRMRRRASGVGGWDFSAANTASTDDGAQRRRLRIATARLQQLAQRAERVRMPQPPRRPKASASAIGCQSHQPAEPLRPATDPNCVGAAQGRLLSSGHAGAHELCLRRGPADQHQRACVPRRAGGDFLGGQFVGRGDYRRSPSARASP